MNDIEIKGTKLCVSLETIINGMTLDQKREMLAWLATDREVVQNVVEHITGKDELGWSTGDPDLCQKILEDVEEFQIRNSKFSWKPWTEIRQKIKDIRSEEHLYWILYHKIDSDLSFRVFNELRRLGVESNYTTKEGDEDIQKIREYIDDAFKAMVKN